MDKRFLLIAGGLVAAIAVVTLAILAGGPRSSGSTGPRPTPPQITNRGITAEDLENPNAKPAELVEVAEGMQFYSEDGETVTLFTGDRVVPQPNFVSDVIRPAAEVRFSAGRLLRVTADEGRFYHPGNEPTRGEFHRNTVVTQYEAPDGEPIDLDSDRHVQFRVYLDELTRFDRENGHIQSDGPVRLVGPAVDFTGTGLDLTFNMLDQRVERLVIDQGDELRLAQGSNLTTTRSPGEASPESSPSNLADPQASPPQQTEGHQPYLAILYDNLDINVGPDNTTLTGDRLEALFTLAPGSDPGSDNEDADNAVARSAPASAAFRPNHPTVYVNNLPPNVPADPRALLTPSPSDVVVKWTGRLELQPIRPQAPISPASVDIPAPDQAVLTLHGSPAVLNNPAEDQRISAAAVGYRTDGKTVFADGSDAHPFVLDSPELGNLQAVALTLSESDAGGQILGPGRLNADEQGLRVSFADRLDLAFNRDADDSLADLRSATFHGDVNAVAESDDPEQQLDLTSQSLALTLTPDAEGNAQPSHLQALGSAEQPVFAQQPNRTFQANSLDVDLGRLESTQTSESESTESEIEITRLRALGNITVQLIEEETTLTAHALDADPRVGRLALFGENERSFATLSREGAELAGVHLILQEDAQTADALGPGTFSADVDEDDPTAKLNIAWSESMAFDNAKGKAKFVGDVRSASTSNTDDTSLDAHTLSLEFVPQDLEDETSESVPVASAGALDLRRAHALADPENPDDQVNFTAQEFTADGPADRPLTRLTLIGRELVFINQPPNLTNLTTIDDNITVEQVIVPTRGNMLLEDYRTETVRSTADNENPVNFGGRGVTLFAWEDQLTLDAQANDLRLEKDVFMVHRPAPGSDGKTQEPIKLDAQRLVADLTETGGLGAYLSADEGTAPQAQIRRVNADGRVRVAQGESNIVADHLEYEEADRAVLFWAEPRREVELNRDDQPNGRTTARALRWDLDKNFFTAVEPGAGLIPIE
ncbi:MAG: hypothetical protein AAGH99_03685 [Planctomycetota bacterium]